MYRIGAVILMLWLAGCNGDDAATKSSGEESTSPGKGITAEGFKKISPPYSLSDTFLLAIDDTATLQSPLVLSAISDSLKQSLFGSSENVKYTPLVQMDDKSSDSYLIVKATAGGKTAAIIIATPASGEGGIALPFLQPDNDPATQQTSTIDKSFTITRSVTRRIPDEVSVEGKDVYVFNRDAKNFTLIMTDQLDDGNTALINPIDTLGQTHRFAGDYTKDKNNIVSIRDAPNAAEFNFFIHIEKGEDCIGELKGTALMTSSKTAVFRQGGNPCVMEFSFSGSNVSIKEAQGCGSQRSIGCTMDGTFSKKKASKDKTKKPTAKSGA